MTKESSTRHHRPRELWVHNAYHDVDTQEVKDTTWPNVQNV